MRIRVIRALLTFAIAVAPPIPAAAYTFIHLYGGFSIVDDEVALVSHYPEGQTASRTVDYGAGFTGGLRMGGFSKRAPFVGFAYDIPYYQVRSDTVNASVVSFSPMLIIRAPIRRTEKLPQGQFVPYVGIGPTFSRIRADIDFRPDVSREFSDVEFDIGYQVTPGVAVGINKDTSFFIEYRYAWHSVGFNEQVCPVGSGLCSWPKIGKAELQAHLGLVGVSLRF